MTHLAHIADRVLNRPLMILPEKLALIASVLEGRIALDASDLRHLSQSEASRFVGNPIGPNGRSKVYNAERGVAIIPVLGSLVNRGAWIGARSGITSYEGLAHQLDQAARDPHVKAILLDIDSPGGEAVGAFELADKIAIVTMSKPVFAHVNGMAASAAYALASACTFVSVTSSSVLGSIGVVLMHADYSVALHQKGIKPTLIHAGAHKVDGNPYQPLSSSVRADLQAEVDKFYSMFVSTVAKGRKGRMTEKTIRSTEARTFIGQSALEIGLVDALGNFETAMKSATKGYQPRPAQETTPQNWHRSSMRNAHKIDVAEIYARRQSDAEAEISSAVPPARIPTLDAAAIYARRRQEAMAAGLPTDRYGSDPESDASAVYARRASTTLKPIP